ncbi:MULTISPECIES: carbohydrate ABC transporter permease [Bacillus]|uniref:carbohydrate ABC transporter permease n=1 Tax=Bacillus TaxID=1386 RepID=UPI00040D00D0|nr:MULTISPECIES: carbohydrate ABC transporter permease [Bacillus]QHZ45596.1 carbohydrate ABC transporter permease [Bacillus sp. NSP9.1]WFA04598.1 carbohydrate ABC transporter permease [Bacillus sp. HSf4]
MPRRKEWLLNIIGIFITAVFLFPVYWMIVTALKSEAELFKMPPSLWPETFQLSNFQAVFKEGVTGHFMNSVLISGVAAAIVLLLAVPSAYGLARFPIRGRKWFILLFLVTQMLPATVILTPLFIAFNKLHILNTYIGPILAAATLGIPFSVLMLRTFFLGIPKELEDAAKIDGCSRFTAFVRIILPVAMPGIAVSGAISFFFAWGDLIYSMTFNRNQELWPLTAGIYNVISQYGIQWNHLMAFAVISVVPVIIMFVMLQKHLVKGLVSGSIK